MQLVQREAVKFYNYSTAYAITFIGCLGFRFLPIWRKQKWSSSGAPHCLKPVMGLWGHGTKASHARILMGFLGIHYDHLRYCVALLTSPAPGTQIPATKEDLD